MIILKILLGVLALSIIVIIHEAGHMIAARRSGITVEAFSVGWGKILARWQRGDTEYRLSLLPLGGYCKLKGENAFAEAWENKEESLTVEPGDFYAAPAAKRILVALAGPLFNFIFALIIFSVFWMTGFTQQSYGNRIVLVSDVQEEGIWPADEAGLQTGDRILEIGGDDIRCYQDIQEAVAPHARESLPVLYRRNSQNRRTTLTPALNKNTGGGQIGIYPWIPREISTIGPGSPADVAGLQGGDILVSAQGEPLQHYMQLVHRARTALNEGESKGISIGYRREGQLMHCTLIPRRDEETGQMVMGISVAPEEFTQRADHPGDALWQGLVQTGDTLRLTFKGIGLLFQGVDINKAVAGPARLIYMMGEVTAQSFAAGSSLGLYSFFQFIAFISVALGFMNLLPLPVLDGGQIILFSAELIKRGHLSPRFVIRYQFVGMALVFLLIIFATSNDILFLARS